MKSLLSLSIHNLLNPFLESKSQRKPLNPSTADDNLNIMIISIFILVMYRNAI